ncbi:unnamed protein product [Caenorhabditis auriculariae]|uniref:G-protein coupled receptors family 1 profile domain-containing protein n=1 Tax=Caenorhabditis auriculariae TaxID=2777116 RepID=A0A8S1HT15_9PELO|nr:unnamed protein product [Caenorhabditis auriculariae]
MMDEWQPNRPTTVSRMTAAYRGASGARLHQPTANPVAAAASSGKTAGRLPVKPKLTARPPPPIAAAAAVSDNRDVLVPFEWQINLICSEAIKRGIFSAGRRSVSGVGTGVGATFCAAAEDVRMDELLIYAIAELLLSIHISFSNLLVLWVYVRTKHVRTVTNTYIFSLALTDFLAGALGIPLTVLSVLTRRPHSFYGCLFVHLILCILCTISTFHMLAIAIDKYTTICCRDQIFRSRRSKAVWLLAASWFFGSLIAILPLFNAFGFADTATYDAKGDGECHFTKVVDYRYLVYVIFFGTILTPTALIVFLYTSIYSRIRKEEKQVKCLLRQSEREKRMQGRRKLIRILLILVVSYGICWYPLYVINTIDYFWPQFSINRWTLWTVVMSHFSCALNPLIYAYGMPGFKKALRAFFNVQTDGNMTCGNYSCYMRSTLNHKQQYRAASAKTSQCPTTFSAAAIRKISAPAPLMRHTLENRRKTIAQVT